MIICVLELIVHNNFVIFIQLLESPILSYCLRSKYLLLLCQKCIKESNFNEKMDQNFHICSQSGPRGLTPPTLLYGQLDRKISVFYASPYYVWKYSSGLTTGMPLLPSYSLLSEVFYQKSLWWKQNMYLTTIVIVGCFRV